MCVVSSVKINSHVQIFIPNYSAVTPLCISAGSSLLGAEPVARTHFTDNLNICVKRYLLILFFC